MSKHVDEMLEEILQSFDDMEHIRAKDIPGIDLYMDQVTTFMEDHLKQTVRDPEHDKIMTKTMINNYAKNKLLPPPEKKKYTKEHMLFLLFIYYYKNALSITDINNLFGPLKDEYFDTKDGLTLSDLYDKTADLCTARMADIKKDILNRLEVAKKAFPDADEAQRDYLEQFVLISTLGYDVYIKTLFIEKLLDQMMAEKAEMAEKENSGKKNNEKKNNGKKA